MRYSAVILVSTILFISQISFAEEVKLDRIVVSATKTEEASENLGTSISIIDSDDIKKSGKNTVSELLRTITSLNVVQSGGLGAQTSVYLRGAKPGYTLVMIDGIEMNDPMSAGKSFNFAHLTADNIERIEILRGPQSTLYGSDAIGGVVNIITKRGHGNTKLEASSEAGSFGTFREYLSLSGSNDKIGHSLSISRIDSRGFSMAKDGKEDDSYENSAISSRVGVNVSENNKLDFILRYTKSITDIDDGAYDDDPNYVARENSLALKTQLIQKLTDNWEHNLSLSWFDVKRRYRDDPDSQDPLDAYDDWYYGNDRKIDWLNNFSICDIDKLTAGLEYEEERGAHRDIDRRSVNNKAFYLQNQLNLWERFFTTLGVRIDDHSSFGSDTNYKVSSNYFIEKINSRVKANLGTGFKAPSLYQLYDPTYGNSGLSPDESFSYDIALEQGLTRSMVIEVGYFHNRFKNMIDYDFDTNKYRNIGKSKTSGTEVGMTIEPAKDLKLNCTYTRTNTRDNTTGKELARRPKNKFSFNINKEFFERLNLNMVLNYFGHRWDNTANTSKMKPYTRIDFAATYKINENFDIFSTIENLLNKKYEEVRGYSTAGFSFYIGVKKTF
jgi:vitamin B12 transporter